MGLLGGPHYHPLHQVGVRQLRQVLYPSTPYKILPSGNQLLT